MATLEELIRQADRKRPKAGGEYVSRQVLEREIGRKLGGEEVAHHMNGNTQDNDAANLALFESNGKHISYHWQAKAINEQLARLEPFQMQKPAWVFTLECAREAAEITPYGLVTIWGMTPQGAMFATEIAVSVLSDAKIKPEFRISECLIRAANLANGKHSQTELHTEVESV